MDFEGLHADKDMILNKHFTSGRGGKKIEKVVIHYNAADLSIKQCYNVWQTREASAHYQVQSDGLIGQLVHDWDTAWHAGVFSVNQTSIGIEHANRPDGTITPECLDAGAHLTAAVCKFYNLGIPQWGVNVFPHKWFSPTACPGQIYGSQKNDYIRRAQDWYLSMTNGKPAPKPTPTKPSNPSKPVQTNAVDVDGYLGTESIKELQKQLRTPADGVVSGQCAANHKYYPRLMTAQHNKPAHEQGSQMVQALQIRVGAVPDGIIGKETVIHLQQWLNLKGYKIEVDGYLGANTAKAVQNALNSGLFKK